MPDENETEPTPTADQQIDGQVNIIKVVENIPFVGGLARTAYASGGGGEGGHFAISSLAELDVFIGRWESIAERMDLAREKLLQARLHVLPPAEDAPSRYEAQATIASLDKAIDHNLGMRDYAIAYIDKLKATRADYAGTEGDNTTLMGNSDGA